MIISGYNFRIKRALDSDNASDFGWCVSSTGIHTVPPQYDQAAFTDGISGKHLWRDGRYSSCFHLTYIADGTGQYRSRDTGLMNLNSGDALLVFPAVWHALRPTAETGWNEVWISFNGAEPSKLWKNAWISTRLPVIRKGSVPQMEAIFSDIRDYVLDPASSPIITIDHQLRLSAMVHQLVSGIASATVLCNQRDQLSAAIPIHILEVKAYLEENVHTDIDTVKLAEACAISVTGLRRQFNHFVGLTPHEYHARLRMQAAKTLLLEPEYSVGDVSDLLGYQDAAYFSRVFKKSVGICPNQWKESNRLHG